MPRYYSNRDLQRRRYGPCSAPGTSPSGDHQAYAGYASPWQWCRRCRGLRSLVPGSRDRVAPRARSARLTQARPLWQRSSFPAKQRAGEPYKEKERTHEVGESEVLLAQLSRKQIQSLKPVSSGRRSDLRGRDRSTGILVSRKHSRECRRRQPNGDSENLSPSQPKTASNEPRKVIQITQKSIALESERAAEF